MVKVIIKTISGAVNMSRIVGLFNLSCFLRVSLALIIVHGQSQRSIIIVQRCHYYHITILLSISWIVHLE